jgi:signal transduction histidine kinase
VFKKLYPHPSLLTSGLATFKRQETIFVGLNLLLLGILLCAHSIFGKYWGVPDREMIAALIIAFLVNAAELAGLQFLSRPLSMEALAAVTWASILGNLSIAFLLSVFSNSDDSPYYVLMVVPILQAAFRFPLGILSAVVTLAGCLNFLWVWYYFQSHQPLEVAEYLEAGVGALIFAIVGFVVWLLVRDLRQKEDRLAKNLHDLQETREKLLHEEKLAAVGRLSSAIAHEIRNPVSLISTSIATAKQVTGSEREEMYEIASEEASRLVSLSSDFLSYAHPRKPKPVSTSVADNVAYVSDACRPHASGKDVSLRVNVEDALIAEADPGQIQQALINLLLNAIDAASPGSTVTVSARERAEHVQIEVENLGMPIPAAERGLIFEPFFTTKPKGTGLGLSIARNIARAHGGDLLLACNGPDKICFALCLPIPNGKHGPARDGDG